MSKPNVLYAVKDWMIWFFFLICIFLGSKIVSPAHDIVKYISFPPSCGPILFCLKNNFHRVRLSVTVNMMAWFDFLFLQLLNFAPWNNQVIIFFLYFLLHVFVFLLPSRLWCPHQCLSWGVQTLNTMKLHSWKITLSNKPCPTYMPYGTLSATESLW